MTKPLDIPPDLLERARHLTQGRTDEESILRSVALLVGLQSPSTFDWSGTNPDDITPLKNEAGQYMTRAQLDEKRARQMDAIALLGTFDSLVSDEEFDVIRGRSAAAE